MDATFLPEWLEGPDGVRYYIPSVAAQRLARTPRQIERMTKADSGEPELAAVTDPEVLALHVAPGRPPSYVLEVDAVEAVRARVLRELGVESEMEALTTELADVRAAWEVEVRGLQSRLEALEDERTATLDALEARLNASVGQLEADKLFLRALRPGRTP